MMVNVVVLTGAGVSTTAGIGDFKSTDEEWPYDLPREKMMTHAFLRQHPEQFWDMYRSVFAGVNEPHEPTAFHHWVASLERNNNVVVITQNIDGLHQAAGTSRVLELHGASGSYVDVDEARRTGQPCLFNASDFPQLPGSVPRSPVTGNLLKPSVVLFDDPVKEWEVATSLVGQADVLVVAGTRLNVAPANQLPLLAMYSPCMIKTFYINNERAPWEYDFTREFIMGTDDFVAQLEANQLPSFPNLQQPLRGETP